MLQWSKAEINPIEANASETRWQHEPLYRIAIYKHVFSLEPKEYGWFWCQICYPALWLLSLMHINFIESATCNTQRETSKTAKMQHAKHSEAWQWSEAHRHMLSISRAVNLSEVGRLCVLLVWYIVRCFLVFCCFSPSVFIFILWVLVRFYFFICSIFLGIYSCFSELLFVSVDFCLQDPFVLQKSLPSVQLRSNFNRLPSLNLG